MNILRLNLKGEYFDAIKSGTKTHEFRLAATWERRLAGKTFAEIHLFRGYPKRGDESKILRRRWNGYEVQTITHPHFGPNSVKVLAIDVSRPVQKYATAIRDGYTVPLIGIPASAQPSSGDFRDDPIPCP